MHEHRTVRCPSRHATRRQNVACESLRDTLMRRRCPWAQRDTQGTFLSCSERYRVTLTGQVVRITDFRKIPRSGRHRGFFENPRLGEVSLPLWYCARCGGSGYFGKGSVRSMSPVDALMFTHRAGTPLLEAVLAAGCHCSCTGRSPIVPLYFSSRSLRRCEA